MKSNKLFLIFALFMVLLCCFSAVSASEDVTDDAVAVSDDVTVDEVVSEVDSGDGSIATEDDESLESVDDSGNESLAVQDVEQVDDVDNTTLTAENENESDVNDTNSTLTAENENESDVNDTNSTLTAEVDDELSGQSHHNESGLDTSQNSQFESASDDYFECYVGSNENDGDGSPENPFSTLMLARNKIVETNTKNAIINIYDGTYQVPRNYESQNKPFTFATDNLIINGIGKNVILIPDKNDNDRSFVLTTTSANFTMNNIIFNSAAGTTKAITADNKFFKPVSGNVNAKITNCTFLGNQYTQLPRCIDFNTSYIGCIFKDFTSDYLIYSVISESSNFIYFENCVFSNLNITRISSGVDKNKVNVTFNGIWIGQNSLPTYTVQSGNNYASGTFDIFTYGKQNDMDIIYFLPVKYAIFSVSENYLGNDQYEIVGRLTWNGTDSSEGIENFPPLTVILTSTTGEIQPTATLVNGTFKVNYTSSSFGHNVTAKLDSEEINLPFITKVKDYIFNISEITDVKVGDTKEITITLPDNADGQIVISVGDSNNFTETVNGNTTKVNITGFSHGENIINVIYSGNERYEPNTKIIKVSALKETTLTTTNITTTYNVAKDLVVTLVANGDVLANKTVNVVVGTINKNLTTNASGQVNIDVSTLAPNTYVANIAFAGDDLYIKSNTTANVVINKVASSLSAPKVTATYNVAKDLVVTLVANGDVLANKTVNVVVGTINKNLTTNASGQVNIDVSTLAPNTYVANIAFAGDDLYIKSNTTANVVINKVASSLSAPKVTATYNVAKDLVVTLVANGKPLANQKVIVKVGTISKTLTTNDKGQVSVDVSKLTPKTYTATFTYAGDTINAKSTNTAKVVINKATSKLTAKKATFKAKTKTKKYNIVLKDNKGKAIKKAKVTLKVKGKTYKATTNAKGKATFKITKLTKKGTSIATIKFAGNKYFKSISKKAKIIVKK